MRKVDRVKSWETHRVIDITVTKQHSLYQSSNDNNKNITTAIMRLLLRRFG